MSQFFIMLSMLLYAFDFWNKELQRTYGGEVSLGWDVDLFLSQLLVVRKLKMLDFSDFADTEFELTG